MVVLAIPYTQKLGFYEKSLVWKLEIYEETRFLASGRVSPPELRAVRSLSRHAADNRPGKYCIAIQRLNETKFS